MSYRDALNSSVFSGPAAYERFMGRWSRELAPHLVRFADVRDGDRVLDVGAGTGALTAAVAELAPDSRIAAIDPAAAYVAFLDASKPSERVTTEVGDARHLRFADATFDRTLSLLAINFVPDPAQAVAEMKRVTRRGGIVAAAVWDYGDGMEMLRVFWDEAIRLRPENDDRDERHMPLCRRGELTALWREHGLEQVVEEGLTIETRFVSFDDYWDPFTEKQGPAGAYVGALTAAERNSLRLSLRHRLLKGGPEGPFVLIARAWAVRGTVAELKRS